jgi:integrase
VPITLPVCLAHGRCTSVSGPESGAETDRTQLARAIAALQSGDVLIITLLDRLARSTRDLLNVLAAIADKQAGFKSLNEPMIDTTSAHGKLVTGILACIGEFERELIRARMLRHACGYALANKGHDTRAIQAWLGHRSITSAAIYTALAPNRFKNFWRD